MNKPTDSVLKFDARLSFYARRWLPAGEARAAVVFVHGWGDHCGRYAEVAQFLAAQGYRAYAFDFEGHGRSPGKRAQVGDFDVFVSDLADFVRRVRGDVGERPVFLCGYSMGGLIAASYVAFHTPDVAGVVFNSSALEVSKDIPQIKKLLARALGGAFPGLPVSALTAGPLMSRDAEEIRRYDADPLIHHGKMTAGTGRQLLLAHERIERQRHRIAVPFLILQGTADTLVDPHGAQRLYELSPSTDKTLRLYEGALHDLFHETNRAEVIAQLKDWLDRRSAHELREQL